VDADLAAIAIDYNAAGNEVLNNGHTIQVNYGAGSSITVDGRDFELQQFHFHAPSENTIGGKSYAMEAHLVHADADGNLAVIAVMFEGGDASAALAGVWDAMPKEAGGKAALHTKADAGDLLPEKRDYYRFTGSLTTPPCSEGVIWLVMKDPVTASKEQIAKFAGTMGHANNRPVQPLNARVVLQ
jgi:carbonic anhydrase